MTDPEYPANRKVRQPARRRKANYEGSPIESPQEQLHREKRSSTSSDSIHQRQPPRSRARKKVVAQSVHRAKRYTGIACQEFFTEWDLGKFLKRLHSAPGI